MYVILMYLFSLELITLTQYLITLIMAYENIPNLPKSQ